MQNKQLEIRIDGILQEPSAAERVGNVAMNVLTSAVSATYEASKGLLGEIATNIHLEYLDARNDSTLHAQYHAKKRADRIAAVARQYELV